MVLLKRKCPPERRKALIAIELTTSSPNISINEPEDSKEPFQLVLKLRIAETTQPGRPITIRTDGTIFCPSDSDDELDTLALGTVTALKSTSEPNKTISLGIFRVHHARPSEPQPADLKERPRAHFLTIPAEGSAQVTHDMPVSRIFKYPGRVKKEDIRAGEEFQLGMNDGYVGTTWWCWGDLDADLQEKKFSGWSEVSSSAYTQKPTSDMMEKEEWVVGENTAELVFEDQGGLATFKFTD